MPEIDLCKICRHNLAFAQLFAGFEATFPTDFGVVEAAFLVVGFRFYRRHVHGLVVLIQRHEGEKCGKDVSGLSGVAVFRFHPSADFHG